MRPYLPALALALAALSLNAHADETSKRAKAEQMLSLIKVDTLMQQQLSALQDQIKSQAGDVAKTADSSPEQQKLTTDYLAQVNTVTTDSISWTKVKPGIVQSYSDAFTEPELDGIIAFYKTPSGMALISKTPELSNKMRDVVRGDIQTMRPKLQELTKNYQDKVNATKKPALSTLPDGKPAPGAPSLNPPPTAAPPTSTGPTPAPAPKP